VRLVTREAVSLIATRAEPQVELRPDSASDSVASDLSALKILHILDHSLPLHSGYTFRTQNILNEQRKRGWLPVAVTSPKHEASWKGAPQEKEVIGGVDYYRTGAVNPTKVPFESELRLMRALARRIDQIVEIEKPELLHAHSPVLNVLPALWVGRKRGIPVVYEIRAFWEDAAVDHQTYSEGSWKYKLVRRMETWACGRARQVAVICNGLRDDLVSRGVPEDKIKVVFNGINPDDFRSSQADLETAKSLNLTGKMVLGFVGSFYRYEGLDLLIKAMRKLSDTRSDVVLLLVGGGEMEHTLRSQVEQLDLQNKVVFTGRVPHEKIASMYSVIDVLAYPRYSMRLTELVTPLKPLESMAMSKPLIASDIGGHRELIQNGETGLLFRPGDDAALAKAVEKLLDNSELRERLARQGSNWVRQHHTWEKTTSVYSEMYSEALQGNRHSSR
jgi:PEP-CTERM/exosortase A-associated glycosyltransferase